ncbi:MAG TPA: iron export ABC transporter permease subunit FetB [Gemmatimonadetes bacterium]|nr:iron export ABC transporter permease subunit FetB [Gemmatimonadota bacterium]
MQTLDILEQPLTDLTWIDLTVAVGLVLMAIGVSGWHRTGLARSFAVGAIRTVLQLTLVGYVLVYVFSIDRWYLVVGALLVMLVAATRAAVDRQDSKPAGLFYITGAALLVGSGLTLIYVSVAVVHVDPWYNPRYLIPLFGMILGNAMNAAALAADRLAGEIETRHAEIEAYLALGATSVHAAREPVRRALRASLIPTVNSLMVVGIVSLPGMMTGQILAGSDPLMAIRYQIVVMFMLASAVALAAVIVVLGYRRTFFTAAEQLRPKDS